MKDLQLPVIKWWHTSRDYNTGLMLLSKCCKNQVLVRSLQKKTERFGRRKLEYELPKAVRLNYLDMPEYIPAPDEPADETEDLIHNQTVKNPVSTDKHLGQFPKVIRRLKHEYSELYNKRSVKHKKMADIPELNTSQNNEVRAELLAEIKSISARMETLHFYLKEYETNHIIPDVDAIWPGKEKTEPAIPDKATLKKQRTNLLNANYKDKNRLNYQNTKIGEKENPMPKGPKRETIKLRIKNRLEAISKIEYQLLERAENAD
jgi:hypothetical protein